MKSFAYITLTGYKGALASNSVLICSKPDGTPSVHIAGVLIPWADYGAAVVNAALGVNVQLTGQRTALPLKKIEAAYIDNSFNPFPVYVLFPDTGYFIVCKAYGVLNVPVYTQVLNFNVYCEGFDGVSLPSTRILMLDKYLDFFETDTAPAAGVSPASVKSTAHGHQAAGASIAVTMPAGIAVGDLLIMAVVFGQNGRTATTPALWALLGSLNGTGFAGNNARCYVFYKFADGTEGASVTVNFSGSDQNTTYTAWRIGDVTNNPEMALTENGASTSTLAAPSLTPSWGSQNTLWLTFAGCFAQNILTNPVGFTSDVADTGGNIRMNALSLLIEQPTMSPGNYVVAANAETYAATIGCF